jgi:hypothetical protein
MIMQNIFRQVTIGCLIGLSMSRTPLFAQEPPKPIPQAGSATEKPERRLAYIRNELATLRYLSDLDSANLLAPKSTFNKLVKGQPYSATAVTETLQTLSDGNDITHRMESKIYRDNEGRVRREQTFDSLFKQTGAGNQPRMILIDDPVAGFQLMLDPRTQTARRIQEARPLLTASAQPGDHGRLGPVSNGTGSAEPWVIITPKAPKPDKAAAKPEKAAKADSKETAQDSATINRVNPSTQTSVSMLKENREGAERSSATRRVESLGTQVIEGVQAEGTRTTVTIPAGEIGNRLPIEITDERWYSPELQILIMTKHHDPRSGDSNYRLTDLSRSEPDRSLFEVPSDYRLGWSGSDDHQPRTPGPTKPAVRPGKYD